MVTPPPQVGINAEHSWADAPIIGYAMEYSCKMEEDLGYQQDGHCMGYDGLRSSLPVPRKLQWELPPACVARIHSARKLAEEQIADLELYVLVHDAFGKGVMKKCKISPDAFIQMALQMAYYKVCISILCLNTLASL